MRSFTAAAGGGERTFVLAPQCQVTLGGQDAAFDDLRRGDTFEVKFDEPDAVSPADLIDPEYGRLLRLAIANGVEAIAYRGEVTTTEIRLTERLPVIH